MSATSKKLLWTTFYCLPILAFCANVNHDKPLHAAPIDVTTGGSSYRPAKVIVFKSRRLAYLTREVSEPVLLPVSVSVRAQRLRAFVAARASAYGVNPDLAVWIVRHESQFNPAAKGDGEASRGLWQISKIYHPEVSDRVAFNAVSSTDWSLGRIRDGKAKEWSTYHYCRTLYKDCPF
jgi:hypothetical protein